MFRSNVFLAQLMMLLGAGWVSDAELRRNYEAGPLVAADFLGDAEQIPGASARTVTELGFSFKYRYKSNAKSTTVTLTEIEINAVIRRDKSWNRDVANGALLDHEQGHADIAQIECLRARKALAEKLRARGGVQVTAANLMEGRAALQRELDKEMEKFRQATRDADAEYDRQTMNGLGGKQAEWRRVQQETLKELAK